MEFLGIEQAQKAALANMPPRYRELEALEKWTLGTQYDGRPDWWTGGQAEAPLWERKPCIIYPVVQIAIASNTDLVLGEGRFPTPTTRPGEDETESAEDTDDGDAATDDPDDSSNGLNEDDSNTIDRFVREYHKLSRFKAHTREAFDAAQGCKSACAVHGHRNGKPFQDLIPAKWCTPSLGINGEVESLEIRYPYFEQFRDTDGKWRVRCKLYRRTIDAIADTTYFPGDADEHGAEPVWAADPTRTVAHNLGFCPVIWYPFMRGCGPVNQIDGRAIHQELTDEIQGHDIAISQKHRCALLSEPQPVEIGVTPGYNPTAELGRAPNVPSTQFGGPAPGSAGYDGGNPGSRTGEYMYDGPGAGARKKGPSFMWSYANPETKVEYLVFPPGVLEGMADHADDLLAKIEEALAVVFPKPNQFKGTGVVSGRSIEMSKQRQYDRCDKYRDDLGDNFIIPSINMQLRIATKAREQLKVPGIKKALPILDKFEVTETSNAVAAA